MKKIMEYKGFKAKIMETERLVGEGVHGLPPGSPLDIYHSDEFVNYPRNWMKGFVVPVRPNKGLWFDFTENLKKNTAIVMTVKGCNPITGLPTSGMQLEKYDTKCPKHGMGFKGDRFCTECGHKWPAQNYLSAPNTLWWDTWVAADGIGRQFFFTEDEMRDIATHMIGKENTVPAFGFAFFRPKEARAEDVENTRSYPSYYIYNNGYYWNSILPDSSQWLKGTVTTSDVNLGGVYLNEVSTKGLTHGNVYSCNVNNCSASYSATNSAGGSSTGEVKSSSKIKKSMKALRSVAPDSLLENGCEPVRGSGFGDKVEELVPKKAIKEVSIGAGAKINQDITPDPYALDTWKDTPDASMVIYFVFEEKLNELKAGGMVDLVGKKEGMLDNMPIG